ncbi:MAG TPA: amino acid--[acyl-carrier-protein] ligase [Stellaceae bacterium]|jgi:seryl-tRNA synthetase|nr:amino acid--[acyl-carrier-protein] ligase [Stellaceae bacterium]
MTMIDKTLAQHPAARADAALEAMAAVLFRPMGADGVYARTALYEDIVERLAGLISRHREQGTEILRFPPVMSRHVVEKSGYLKSFPNLLGCVCSLHGSEREIRAAADKHEHGGDWTETLRPAELVLSPAACYPVYPLVAERGLVPVGGVKFDVACDCFRREPSKHLDRLQSFRMREYVCIGTPDEITTFRSRWVDRAQEIADTLGLAYDVAPASDPFFGRTGQVMAISQLQQALKFELLIPVRSTEEPTACMSFNYHLDHFGEIWGIRSEAGMVAHTGCVAFGMDRLAVAMFAQHGVDVAGWPAGVRHALALD